MPFYFDNPNMTLSIGITYLEVHKLFASQLAHYNKMDEKDFHKFSDRKSVV